MVTSITSECNKKTSAIQNTVSHKATTTCKKCGVIHETSKLLIEVVPLKGGSCHHKAVCPACKAFIKFLQHEEPTFRFGKYRGRTVRGVLQSDPRYVNWIVSEGIGSRSFRNLVKEVVGGYACGQQ